MQEIVHKKSLVGHFCVICLRACLAASGIDLWQISFEASKSNLNLNQVFIRTSEIYLAPILIALIPVGAILNIAAWRCPQLAKFICYFELLVFAITMLCPLDLGALHHYACSISTFAECFLFGNFDATSNILFTLVLLLRFFISGPIINE